MVKLDKMMGKKGVSPLIATVLLVGLVIMVALIIFFWYGNYLSEFLEKQGIALEESCSQDVEFYLSSDVSCNIGIDQVSVIRFGVENIGDAELGGFNIIYSSKNNAGAIPKSYILRPAVSTYIEVDLTQDFTGEVFELEIVPLIRLGDKTKYCNNVAQYATIECV